MGLLSGIFGGASPETQRAARAEAAMLLARAKDRQAREDRAARREAERNDRIKRSR